VPKDRQREYKALVWFEGSDSAERATLHARTVAEARALVTERFGPEAKASIWNEDDAKKSR
jgi:hypothetical protein